MRRIGFAVESIGHVELKGAQILHQRQLMSPYVWRDRRDVLHILVRAVPQPSAHSDITGRIWHGESTDGGARFIMDEVPLLTPGPDVADVMGCEDPTVVPTEEAAIVYYTGLDPHRDARMLYAAGENIRTLNKRGIVFQSEKTQRHTKEATVDRTEDGRWRLFYEYQRHGQSMIGLALGDGPAGPWEDHSTPFRRRLGIWDCYHLSTGPLLKEAGEAPVMFYNGANETDRWRIGWIAFSDDLKSVVDRCDDPLLAPSPDARKQRDIAFAASLVVRSRHLWLYYTVDDRSLYRAMIVRT